MNFKICVYKYGVSDLYLVLSRVTPRIINFNYPINDKT